MPSVKAKFNFEMKLGQILLISAILSWCIGEVNGQSYPDPQNHQCLKCHTKQTITFFNVVLSKEQKRLMNPYYILDTIALRKSVHKSFDCTDCHSSEYANYPHKENLKLEPMNNCLDCHGGDVTFASYKFEKIDEEFRKSIHFKVSGENFTCSKCHNQHYYKTTARTSVDILEIVNYSNNMCLSCHNDMRKYQLVSGQENPELIQVHNWLPNQELHFKHVRCIECHAEGVDSLNISHNIQGKDKAVKNCVECHSKNSMLKASLYKYQNLKKREEGNSRDTTGLPIQTYVIGTHQNPLLKLISILIFICVVGGIILHSFFRILKK
jgi:hypothetical protein